MFVITQWTDLSMPLPRRVFLRKEPSSLKQTLAFNCTLPLNISITQGDTCSSGTAWPLDKISSRPLEGTEDFQWLLLEANSGRYKALRNSYSKKKKIKLSFLSNLNTWKRDARCKRIYWHRLLIKSKVLINQESEMPQSTKINKSKLRISMTFLK